ncbi:aminopeptidase P family protein [Mollicutes bacterium LVI A0039]|nr:aminopeptidase P family protein [Mollicutes bacterium LVI A0039]
MQEIFNQVDVLVLTNHENKKYVSGFKGSESLVTVSSNNVSFITDGRYKTAIKKDLKPNVTAYITETGQSHFDKLVDVLKEQSPKTIGVEANNMTVGMYNKLQAKFPECKLVALENVIEAQREIKTEEELDLIKAAVAITDQAFSHVVENIKPGMTEIEVRNMVDQAHFNLGGDRLSFETIVASGPNGALPHANPSNRVIESGDMVTIDFGVFKDEYCSDMTRSFFVGEAKNEKLIEIHNTVHQAWSAQIAAAKAGISGHDLDKIGRDIIEAAGYGEYFIHGTGHSLGLEVHENPRVAKGWNQVLQAGHVVTIEPGIYVEGIGGVRIENDIIIREGGCESLNTSNPNYDVAIKG